MQNPSPNLFNQKISSKEIEERYIYCAKLVGHIMKIVESKFGYEFEGETEAYEKIVGNEVVVGQSVFGSITTSSHEEMKTVSKFVKEQFDKYPEDFFNVAVAGIGYKDRTLFVRACFVLRPSDKNNPGEFSLDDPYQTMGSIVPWLDVLDK